MREIITVRFWTGSRVEAVDSDEVKGFDFSPRTQHFSYLRPSGRCRVTIPWHNVLSYEVTEVDD